MDRHSSDLATREGHLAAAAPMMFGESAGGLLEETWQRLAIPDRLFALAELDVLYDDADQALWTYMRPAARPSFTLPMLGDFKEWQRLIATSFGPGRVPLKYLILGSRAPGVFCFGGDLALFADLIRANDRNGLADYGYACVEILHRNMKALGGGFEALLSFDVIVAERNAAFGLPEIMFGLFPGMGAHAILSRKLGTAQAERLILSNKTWSAEQMYDLGLVHVLAEPGEGEAAVRAFIASSDRKHAGMVGAKQAMRRTAPIELGELFDIVDLWANAALQLRDQDLKLMHRLAGAQGRLPKAAVAA